MTRNAASLASLACTCLRLPGNALLKIFKPSTKETRDVRVVFCVVLVSKGLTLAPVGPGVIQESRAEVSTVMTSRGTVPHECMFGMKPCVLLTFCQLLGHSKARTGRGLACTVSFTCVNDLQVHFQWLQHANGMVHPTGSLFHMSSLACIDVRNTIHLSWCHLSAAGDARPSARPPSRAAPTTRRLGRRAL